MQIRQHVQKLKWGNRKMQVHSSYFQSVHFPFQEEKQAKDKGFTSNFHTHTLLVTWQMVTCDIFQFQPPTPAFQCLATICLYSGRPHTALLMCPLKHNSQGTLNPETYAARLLWPRTGQAPDTHQSILANQQQCHHPEDLNLQHCCREPKYYTYWKIWQQTDITVIIIIIIIIIMGWHVLFTA